MQTTADDLLGHFLRGLHEQKLSHHMTINYHMVVTSDQAEVWAQGYAWNRLLQYQGRIRPLENLGHLPVDLREEGSRVADQTLALHGQVLSRERVCAHLSASAVLVALFFLLIGFGSALVVPALTAALLGTVERSQAGIASGVLNASRQMGGVFGVAVLGSFVGSVSGDAAWHEIQAALAVAGAVLVVGCAIALLAIPSKKEQFQNAHMADC